MNLKRLYILVCIEIFVLLAFCLTSQAKPRLDFKLLMQTQGSVAFAPYVYGISKINGLYPGYRAQFNAHIDFFRTGRWTATGQVGNTTVISRSDTSLIVLDKLRYVLAPGMRYRYKGWLFAFTYYHESVYSISREQDINGAFWQNIIRMGVGSPGTYFMFLPERYHGINNKFINEVDAQFHFGIYRQGSNSIWVARNHNHRYEGFLLLRYHLGVFRKWAYFCTLRQLEVIDRDDATQYKGSITVNAFRKGLGNLFGIYCAYNLKDSTIEDNEDGLGSVGIRVIF